MFCFLYLPITNYQDLVQKKDFKMKNRLIMKNEQASWYHSWVKSRRIDMTTIYLFLLYCLSRKLFEIKKINRGTENRNEWIYFWSYIISYSFQRYRICFFNINFDKQFRKHFFKNITNVFFTERKTHHISNAMIQKIYSINQSIKMSFVIALFKKYVVVDRI